MRQMSFSITTEQIRRRQKTVTRRLGWADLSPGTLLLAIEKGQGLKKGEKVKPICTIRVRTVRRESLRLLMDDFAYGQEEMNKEGFPGRDPIDFVESFADGREYGIPVTRIEFEYLP